MTQSAMARSLGVSLRTVQYWESGGTITDRNQESLVRLLGSEARDRLLEETSQRLAQAVEPVAEGDAPTSEEAA